MTSLLCPDCEATPCRCPAAIARTCDVCWECGVACAKTDDRLCWECAQELGGEV